MELLYWWMNSSGQVLQLMHGHAGQIAEQDSAPTNEIA